MLGGLWPVTGTEGQQGWEASSAYPLMIAPDSGSWERRHRDRPLVGWFCQGPENRGGVPHFVLPQVMARRLETVVTQLAPLAP